MKMKKRRIHPHIHFGPLKVMQGQCATCPFRREGWTCVQDLLTHRAMNEGTPICHSTGPGALVPRKKRISKEPLACRGARDLQIRLMHALGVIDAPTDEAWDRKWREVCGKIKTPEVEPPGRKVRRAKAGHPAKRIRN